MRLLQGEIMNSGYISQAPLSLGTKQKHSIKKTAHSRTTVDVSLFSRTRGELLWLTNYNVML